MSEHLKRAAGDDIPKLKVAGLLLVKRSWCWSDFLALEDADREWALKVLASTVVDGDSHPKALDVYIVPSENEV